METAAEKAHRTGRERMTPALEEKDEDLVRQVLAGNLEAFEVLVRRYNQRLYRLARSLLPDDHDAQEVVQESYVRAYVNLHAFRGPDGFSTWLHVILRNEAFSLLRRRHRETATEAEVMEHILNDTHLPDQPDPASELEAERLGRTLETAIDRLPEAFRAVFVLRAVEGMSVRETAQVLGVNEKTVKTRLFRAKRLLRDRFRGYLQGASRHVYEFAGARCDNMTAAVMARLERHPTGQ